MNLIVCEKEFPLVKSFQVAKKKNKNVWIVPHRQEDCGKHE